MKKLVRVVRNKGMPKLFVKPVQDVNSFWKIMVMITITKRQFYHEN